jgi:hypothetical protein
MHASHLVDITRKSKAVCTQPRRPSEDGNALHGLCKRGFDERALFLSRIRERCVMRPGGIAIPHRFCELTDGQIPPRAVDKLAKMGSSGSLVLRISPPEWPVTPWALSSSATIEGPAAVSA